MLGGGCGVAAGRVHRQNSFGGGGFEIDIVESDAGAADDFQFLGGFDDVSGDIGSAAHDQRVIITDDLLEFFKNDLELKKFIWELGYNNEPPPLLLFLFKENGKK